MSNGYWMIEKQTPKQLDDVLQEILGFGDPAYCHSRLQILKDEPDEITEVEVTQGNKVEIEMTTHCYAVRLLVQADFSPDQEAALTQKGFEFVGQYINGEAEPKVRQRMKTGEAKWTPGKPGKPPAFEKKVRRAKPEAAVDVIPPAVTVAPDNPPKERTGQANGEKL